MAMTSERFKEMYDGSWCTVIGAGGDINEWKEGLNGTLAEKEIGHVIEWQVFFGREMNEEYGLTGDNRYPDDLTFLAFPLDGLDIKRLAIFKLVAGFHWFDDIVDNDVRREQEKKANEVY